MFRASTCPSSGGQIVLSQYLVSSHSVQPFADALIVNIVVNSKGNKTIAVPKVIVYLRALGFVLDNTLFLLSAYIGCNI
jgi:hypothetical protein